MARSRAQSTANTEDLVRQSLLKIALAESPLRLTGKGSDALFAGASAANKAAIAVLKEESLIAESGTGKDLTVSLTLSGFERVCEAIPSENFLPVVQRISRERSPPEQVAILQKLIQQQPAASSPLLPLLEEALAAERAHIHRESRAREDQRAAEAAALGALERWKELLIRRKQQRIDFLKQQLQAEGVEEVDADLPPQKLRRTSSQVERVEPEDGAFRRNVARRLVSSWVDAWESQKKEAREFLESAIWNINGFRSLGEIDQSVRFDGRYHEGGAGLFTNDPVRVVRPGWLLEEDSDHEYIILKALVKKQ